MPVLLHQNLRRFGGGPTLRNQAYLGAFREIARQLGSPGGGGPILVAGGTGIIDDQGPMAWYLLSRALGLDTSFTVATGRDALAPGMEFVGIGVHPMLRVRSVGRILICSGPSGLHLRHDVANPVSPAWCSRLPADTAGSYRTVAYVVAESAQIPPLAVGFLRDPFVVAGDAVAVADQIPRILSMMRSNPAMAGGSGHAFLGGDFNQMPVPRTSAWDPAGRAYEVSQGISPTDLHRLPVGARPGGTTMSGHLHDYWYTNHGGALPGPVFSSDPALPAAAVHVATLDTGPGVVGLMSDHAASILRVG